jgi:hypothetical protein
VDELAELQAQHQRNHGPCGCLKPDQCTSVRHLAVIERLVGEIARLKGVCSERYDTMLEYAKLATGHEIRAMQAEHKLAAAREQLKTVRAGLQAIEWDDNTDVNQCAWCMGWKAYGHDDGCEFVALLAVVALAGGDGVRG